MIKTDLIRSLSTLKDIGDLDTIRAKLSDIIAALEEEKEQGFGPMIAAGFGGGSDGSSTRIDRDTESAIISCIETSEAEQLESILARFPSADLSRIFVDTETEVSVIHRGVELGNEKILHIIFTHSDSVVNQQIYLNQLNGELIEKSVKIKFNKRTKLQGYTPLHYAVMGSWTEKIILDIIRRGGDAGLESTDERKITPFLLACEVGNEPAVRMIIQATKGQCLDSTDSAGNTALHLAAETGNESLVDLLMNVMPTLCEEINDEQKTPIQLAHETGHDNIATVIERIRDSQ